MRIFYSLIFILSFTFTSATSLATDATADAEINAQIEACQKNTAMEWNTQLNRCIGKKEVRAARHGALDCNTITDLKAREKCHLDLAEKNTGLSSDTASLKQGNLNKSMLMNGAGVAYTIVTMISSLAQKESSSTCTSKKIFGVTATAGLASDFYLKYKARKKIKELEGKYKLDTKTNAHEAQESALLYLKEEQETVADIANMEKKRNLLLMAGYAIAGGMAVYEMTPMGQNPSCYKGDESHEKDSAKKELDKGESIDANASPEIAGSSPTAENANAKSAELGAGILYGLKK